MSQENQFRQDMSAELNLLNTDLSEAEFIILSEKFKDKGKDDLAKQAEKKAREKGLPLKIIQLKNDFLCKGIIHNYIEGKISKETMYVELIELIDCQKDSLLEELQRSDYRDIDQNG
jgi:predicted transcriptional regulator